MNPQPELGSSRAMLTPMAEWQFVHSAIASPQNTFLIGRLASARTAICSTPCPRWTASSRSRRGKMTPCFRCFTPGPTPTFPGWKISWASPKSPRRTRFTTGSRARTFCRSSPPAKNRSSSTTPTRLNALTRPDFDGGKIVFLPPETKSSVTVSNQTFRQNLEFKIRKPNRGCEVEAHRPSLVVVAQTYYHDWQRGYGRPCQRLCCARIVAFQAVQVPAGRHQIHLAYRGSRV